MSSKRAKPETKAVEKKAASARLFNVAHLIAFICAFVPNIQLPNVKCANKDANSVINTRASLSDRWKRGVLEKMVHRHWIFNRAEVVRETRARAKIVGFFTVCWRCKGVAFFKSPSRYENHRIATTDAPSIRCIPCIADDELLVEIPKRPIDLIETDIEKNRKWMAKISHRMEDDHEIVVNQKLYDPVRHLETLRYLFPELDACDEREIETRMSLRN